MNMKTCRWCSQPIDASAQRCYHCGTWQRDGADREAIREAQILDRGFLYWAKFVAGALSIVAVIALAVGGFDIYRSSQQAKEAQLSARSSQSEAQEAANTAKYLAERTSTEARQLLIDAREKVDNVLAEGKVKLDLLQKQIADQDTNIARQRADLQEQIEFFTGRAQSVKSGDSLKNQGEAINALQGQIADLQRQIAAMQRQIDVIERAGPLGDAPPPVAQAKANMEKVHDFNEFLRIEQTAVKVTTQTSRQSYDVTFKLCSFIDGSCGADRLRDVFRVVYRFNKDWFSVPDVPVSNVANQFGYTVRVWGMTKVRACIFLSEAATVPIVRAAVMNLSGDPSYWGPDPSAKPSECAGLDSM